MKVLFVGDKPSKTNTNPDVAFLGAKCEARLRDWVKQLGLNWDDCKFMNRTDTFATRSIVFHIWYSNGIVVALGNEASRALRDADHFKLPHPSGRNRQLNDKKFVAQQLKLCKAWLHEKV